MATPQQIIVLLPPGRMVGGNIYVARTTNAEGEPLLYKSGPNSGQPRSEFYCAIAIPKTPGVTHWAHESHLNPKIGAWGMALWNKAALDWPAGQTGQPTFSWKITDGDSQIPNKKMKKPCDQEGYAGHWVIHCTAGRAPVVCNGDGSAHITTVGALIPGYYCQAQISYRGNESAQTAGMYCSAEALALQGFGEPIAQNNVDIAGAGFGGVALPPGASATPVGNFSPPVAPGGVLGAPGGAATLPPGPPAGTVAAIPPGGAALPPPNAGFVAGIAPGAIVPGTVSPPPPAVIAPPPAAVFPMVMGDATYAGHIAAGWNHAQLVAAGKVAA